MNAIFERLTHFAEHALARLKVSSALNPCLWLCALAFPFGLAGAIFSAGAVQMACLALMFIPMLIFSIAYLYFMVVSPDKLRSEEYELKKIALNLIEEKGGAIPIAESSVEAIANYDYKPLPKLTHGSAAE
ncbi:hypothetical protein [Aquabacterium sp. J223]|uniref:hypothetical protein n=1 Tax=Aquabacterium sp. J223 TaxID=2898431 RepID=UPI0021AD69D5|nr:hypothetical protein [Aquabacterium sp. J223]UUX96959.1 hypothetical protein LRS07_06775 [Aquabacterium sp. J223]